jgi:mannan endo-1,4-beta-mannosidase
MKKLSYFLLVFVLLTACSKDDEIINEPDEEQGNPEEEIPEEPEEETPETYAFAPEETLSYMVDASATAETVALFYNLKSVSDNHFIVGQQDAFSSFFDGNDGFSDMKKTTLSDPGLLGSDFMFITDDQNDGTAQNWFYQQEQQIINNALRAYNSGMINAFTWHLREPYEGEAFYSDEMTEFQRKNAFKSILPGGANHDYYKQKLDKVAEVSLNMIGEDGTLSPIIFRPFHEFEKDFFWWGAAYSTPEEFKTVWRFTVDYLKNEKNVHNLLYAFSPDNSYLTKSAYLERYPGDEYVDILGMDNYGDLITQDGSGLNAANQKLQVVSDLAKERLKVAALTETGYFVTPSQTSLAEKFYSENLYGVLTNNDVNIGFMMFWQNYEDSYTVPLPGMDGEEDFVDFVAKDEPLLLNDMHDFYSLPN